MSQAAVAANTAANPAEVLYAVANHVATITLNCPERMNTISHTMLGDITELMLKADNDPAVRVIVLTGTGRAFCAGLDLTSATKGEGGVANASSNPSNLDLKATPPTVMFNLEKPLIAALNGSAAGYGLDMALIADIRLMARGAKLSAAFVKRGILPESGGTWLLPKLLGWSKAAELIFTGRTLDAEEALRLGLVSELVDAAELPARARALAEEIAGNAPLAVQASKRMMRMGLNETFHDHVHHVFLQLLPLLRSADAREGMLAFLEKRTADFKGK